MLRVDDSPDICLLSCFKSNSLVINMLLKQLTNLNPYR